VRWIAAIGKRTLARFELPVLLVIAIALAAAWIFIEVAGAVRDGTARAFDTHVLLALRNPADITDPAGPRWLEELARDMTALGGVGVLSLISVGSVVYLLLNRKRYAALLVAIAVVGGVVLSTLFKAGYDRPRPDLVVHLSQVYTASFPSGHSMMAAIVYMTLGALLARLHKEWPTKIFLMVTAILLTLLVGVSRIYMGVHWPTDVLAGWAAGAAWASLCWLAALWFQSRGAVESAM
jgi:undecaprenyl-diphosphatase